MLMYTSYQSNTKKVPKYVRNTYFLYQPRTYRRSYCDTTDNNEVEFRVPNSEEIARSIGESSVAAATISGLLEPRVKHELAPGYNYADHIK
jgi:hypothetical protein